MATRLEKRLLATLAQTSAEHRLLEPGDRVLVAVSGGKDSHALLYLLHQLRRRAPFEFSLVAVNIDQGHPGFPAELLPAYFRERGWDFEVVTEDTYSVVQEHVPPGKTTCSLCSRLRRGILYTTARRLGCTKVALGHHRDDAIETLLLNLFFSGQLKAMPARLHADDGVNVVIRPLLAVAEADLTALAAEQGFPIIPCDLCGSQEQLERKRVKSLIAQLAAHNPKVPANLFAALSNVRPSHLLDPRLALREDAPDGEPSDLVPAEALLRGRAGGPAGAVAASTRGASGVPAARGLPTGAVSAPDVSGAGEPAFGRVAWAPAR